MSSLSRYEIIFLTNHWLYQHFTVSQMKNVQLFMIKNSKKQRIRIVECKQCEFLVSINKWRYSNFNEKHANVCSNCFFLKQYQQYVAECEQKKRQKKQIRLIENAQLIKQRATFQKIQREIELQQQRKRAKIETVRIAKKQQKIEKTRLKIFVCKRCSAKFSNNTKFHQHIHDHHQKKIEKFVANEFAMFSSFCFVTSNDIAKFISIAIFASMSTFFFTSKAKLVTITIIAKFTSFATFVSSSESTLMFISFITFQKSIFDISFSLISVATSIATSISIVISRKSISWFEITSRSIIASKRSRFSIVTSKKSFKTLKIATIVCSSTSSFIFFQKSISKHQHQHQKFYFIIDDLFEMFVEKRTKSNLLQIKKIEFFSRISHQFKITFYFKFAINQNKSISQNSKISNSKNFQQYTFAKSNRVKFTSFNKWFEKSIILLYKTSNFFRLHIFEISNISSYEMSNISNFQSMIAFCKSSIHLFVSFISRTFFRHFRLFACLSHLQRYFRIEQWFASTFTNNSFQSCISSWIWKTYVRTQYHDLKIVDRIVKKQIFFLFFTVYYY